MPYYETIEEDLARAKALLAEGKSEIDQWGDLGRGTPRLATDVSGGTIYGKDTYAAYKLLESFVAEIEQMRKTVAAARGSATLASAFQRQAEHGEELADAHNLALEREVIELRQELVEAKTKYVCACGTTMVCPDIGCDLHKVPEPTLTCAGCDKPVPTKTVPMFCPTCSSAEERKALRRALQTVMQVLGPDGVPVDVDYGNEDNLAGLSEEVAIALQAVRLVGIEYQHRRPKP